MYRQLIDQFFKEHPVKENEIPPAAAMTHFQIKLMLNPDTDDYFRGIINKLVFEDQPLREEQAEAEKTEIEAATPDKLIRIMRRNPDTVNQNTLVKQIVISEDEIIPEIISRLKTSLNGGFIEIAAKVLVLCNKNYTKELYECYKDIRNPYAQSVVLLIFGFRADETYIPWIVEEYDRLKKLYPNETYCEGATYALYELENRLYAGKK